MRKYRTSFATSNFQSFTNSMVRIIRKFKLPWAIITAFILLFIYCSGNERHALRDYSELVAQVFLSPVRMLTSTIIGISNEEPPMTLDITSFTVDSHVSESQYVKMLETENQRLKELLEFRQHNHLHTIALRVMGYSRAFSEHRLFVNAGSVDGLVEGMVVMHQEGLVGQVVSVNEYTAWVMTIYDPLSRIPAVMALSRQKAIVCGESSGAAELMLRYTEFDSPEHDEIAISSGEGGMTPPGLYIGKVVKTLDGLRVVSSVPWATLDYVLALSVKK